jgi:hypothetical protein
MFIFAVILLGTAILPTQIDENKHFNGAKLNFRNKKIKIFFLLNEWLSRFLSYCTVPKVAIMS